MHSFQPSRIRIFFQVLCAFGMSASLAGAWMQTGATALAAAASIPALYGLVHFFDLFRRNPAVETEPQRIDFDTPLEMQPVPSAQEASPRPFAIEPQLVVDNEGAEDEPVVEPEPIEPPAPPAKAARAKPSRKAGGRRPSSSKGGAAEPAPAQEDANVVRAIAADPPDAPEKHSEEEGMADPPEVPLHPPVAPLFEPETLGRPPQRAMFGRKVR